MIRLYWFNKKKNIGDHLNLYLLEKLTDKKIRYVNPSVTIVNVFKRILRVARLKKEEYIVSDYLFPWQKHYLCIGSILNKANKNSIVWGSGCREYEDKVPECEILAVRGFLTLDVLKKNHIHISEDVAIGDPALLLPLFYKPQSLDKTFPISIVPHYRDYNSFKALNKSYHLINVQTENIEDFVNQIVHSKCVLSSSLHGLIIAHAYGVPALWIRFNDVRSSEFKYLDYFSSVGIEPYLGFTNINDIFESEQLVSSIFYKNKEKSYPRFPICSLQKELLKVCPFSYSKLQE